MRFKGVIFDLDGTLLDSLKDVAGFANIVLRRYGFSEREVFEYKNLAGEGSFTLMKKASNCDDNKLVLKMSEEFKSVYENEIGESKPFEAISDILESLEKEGIKKAILSNKPDSLTKECAKKFFKDFSFEAIYGQTQQFELKPDPSCALFIASIFGLNPSEIAFVGDTKTDMQTAANGGFYPVGVSWGFRGEEELRRFGAKTIVHKPQELLGLWG